MKKYVYSLPIFTLIIIILASCKKDNSVNITHLSNSIVANQLRIAGKNLTQIMGIPSSITFSQQPVKIETEDMMEDIKKSLLNSETTMPCNLFNGKLQLITINEFNERKKAKPYKTLLSNISPLDILKSDFEKAVHLGDSYTNIYIKIGNDIFSTKCFFNDKGIVYNNILSYYITIKKHNFKLAPSFTKKVSFGSDGQVYSSLTKPAPPEYKYSNFITMYNEAFGWIFKKVIHEVAHLHLIQLPLVTIIILPILSERM